MFIFYFWHFRILPYFIKPLLSHTSIQENSELKVLKYIKFWGEIFNNRQNALFGTNVYETLESSW